MDVQGLLQIIAEDYEEIIPNQTIVTIGNSPVYASSISKKGAFIWNDLNKVWRYDVFQPKLFLHYCTPNQWIHFYIHYLESLGRKPTLKEIEDSFQTKSITQPTRIHLLPIIKNVLKEHKIGQEEKNLLDFREEQRSFYLEDLIQVLQQTPKNYPIIVKRNIELFFGTTFPNYVDGDGASIKNMQYCFGETQEKYALIEKELFQEELVYDWTSFEEFLAHYNCFYLSPIKRIALYHELKEYFDFIKNT